MNTRRAVMWPTPHSGPATSATLVDDRNTSIELEKNL